MIVFIRRFLRVLSYVSVFPSTFEEELSTSEWEREFAGLAKYLPLVGILLGAILSLSTWILVTLRVNQWLVGLIVTMLWLCFTGGFHFDGLMDAADGLFSHRDRERMLVIMSDSRAGNYAVMAALCIFLIKVFCLAIIPTKALLLTLFVVPSWARWSATYAMGKFTYLREEGKGKIWQDIKFPRDLWIGATLPAVACAVAYIYGAPIVLVASIATIICGLGASHWISYRLGGHTGDTYGAVVELAEAGSLLGTALCLSLC